VETIFVSTFVMDFFWEDFEPSEADFERFPSDSGEVEEQPFLVLKFGPRSSNTSSSLQWRKKRGDGQVTAWANTVPTAGSKPGSMNFQ
jgi:hypothetical protein